MRSHIRRSIFKRHRRVQHYQNDSRPLLKLLMIFLLIIIIFLYIFHARFKPAIRVYAEHQAQNQVHQIINSQIEKALSSGGISYQSFVNLEKDSDGRICAISTNMSAMNTFKARVTDAILKENADMPPFKLKIPAGVLLGNEYFAGHGPNIPVKILPFSSIKTSYSNSFTSAGINQTRHQIMLNFSASVNMLFPGFNENMEVRAEVCVAETVIVGTTPQFFAGMQNSAPFTDFSSVSD